MAFLTSKKVDPQMAVTAISDTRAAVGEEGIFDNTFLHPALATPDDLADGAGDLTSRIRRRTWNTQNGSRVV
jgi:hypothetical protein